MQPSTRASCGSSFAREGENASRDAGEGGWVDRVEDKEVILQERKDQRAARLLQTERDLLTSKACPSLSDPLGKSFRGVIDDEMLCLASSEINQTDIMLFV